MVMSHTMRPPQLGKKSSDRAAAQSAQFAQRGMDFTAIVEAFKTALSEHHASLTAEATAASTSRSPPPPPVPVVSKHDFSESVATNCMSKIGVRGVPELFACVFYIIAHLSFVIVVIITRN